MRRIYMSLSLCNTALLRPYLKATGSTPKSPSYIIPCISSVAIQHNNIHSNSTIKMSQKHSPTVGFEEVEAASANGNALIVDVREPHELKETGVIPGSINIPLGQLECVLSNVSEQEFKANYGINKPTKNSPIIFSCLSGKRSADAAAIAKQLGYSQIQSYKGGWREWSEKIGRQ